METMNEAGYKECERLGNEIDKLKRWNQKILKSKGVKKHPDYIELKKELKLTEEAYRDVCIERDKLKKALLLAENEK